MGDLGSIPGLGRFPGEGKGYPFQYYDLENSMDYSPWGHKESDTSEQLSLSLGSCIQFYSVVSFSILRHMLTVMTGNMILIRNTLS